MGLVLPAAALASLAILLIPAWIAPWVQSRILDLLLAPYTHLMEELLQRHFAGRRDGLRRVHAATGGCRVVSVTADRGRRTGPGNHPHGVPAAVVRSRWDARRCLARCHSAIRNPDDLRAQRGGPW